MNFSIYWLLRRGAPHLKAARVRPFWKRIEGRMTESLEPSKHWRLRSLRCPPNQKSCSSSRAELPNYAARQCSCLNRTKRITFIGSSAEPKTCSYQLHHLLKTPPP